MEDGFLQMPLQGMEQDSLGDLDGLSTASGIGPRDCPLHLIRIRTSPAPRQLSASAPILEPLTDLEPNDEHLGNLPYIWINILQLLVCVQVHPELCTPPAAVRCFWPSGLSGIKSAEEKTNDLAGATAIRSKEARVLQ